MRGEGRGGVGRGGEGRGGEGEGEGSGGEGRGRGGERRQGGAQTSNSSVERYQSTILLLTKLQLVWCRLNTQNQLSYKQHEPH